MSIKINQKPTDKEWKSFTIFGSKKNSFSTETYFRESYFDGYQILGDQFLNIITRTAVVVLKPEVFAARRAMDVIRLIEKYDFRIKLGLSVKYNRHKIRETWRYQYSEATIDRMCLVDHLYCLGDALVLFFEDTSREISMPASARLHKLKGASEERLRTAESLRSIIKIPNGVIRFFHIPDEPADIIREIGILFSNSERVSLYQSLKEKNPTNLENINILIDNLENQHPKYDFSLNKAWSNVLSFASGNVQKNNIYALKEKIESGDVTGWEDVYNLLSSMGCNIYDILSIASCAIKQDVDYEFHLIDGDALRGWDSSYFQKI
ncbi:nucleoside-diphosphate kinase [Pectobacterium versatile]|uniref:nucleoside-diphosphate kinase n=1 Tax=Pectobacterium versatile TaxID=2488639 RepID=UPI00208F5262|nr:nucleoside-diphosphate kinase [Pectobacterium versatile]MCO4313302.1 hypothetical protein [Pectobacterium versatile]